MSKKSLELRLESQQLLVEYYHKPTIGIRNKIVVLNTGLVRVVAHRISKMCPEPYDDLEQIGHIGLINAIKNFNPLQNNCFSTYAIPCIDGNIRHYLRDRSRPIRLPRRLEDLYKRGEKFRKALTNQRQTTVTDLEIAEHLEISLNEWHEALKVKDASAVLSLDTVMTQLEGGNSCLIDNLPDEIAQIDNKAQEEYQVMHSFLETLDLKYRQVVSFVYLDGLPKKKAAKLIGVSPMTVSRRLEIAIRLMKAQYNNEALLSR